MTSKGKTMLAELEEYALTPEEVAQRKRDALGGNEISALELGDFYYLIEKDTIDLAVRWYSLAAKLGHPEALHVLSDIYEDILDEHEECMEDISYYKKLADEGDVMAKMKMVNFYSFVENDFEWDSTLSYPKEEEAEPSLA